MALPIEQFNAIADRLVSAQINSSFFEVQTFLSLVSGQAKEARRTGRPGSVDILGSMKKNGAGIKRRSQQGSTNYEFPIHIAKFGGGGGVGYRQPVGSVSTIDIIADAKVPYTHYNQPVEAAKDDLEAAQGQSKIIDLLLASTDLATQEIQDNVSASIFSGLPANQTDKILSAFISLNAVLDWGTNTSLYGSGNRSTSTDTGDLALRSAVGVSAMAAATNFSFSLIDDVNKGDKANANPNGGAATLGKGVDLVLCNEDLYFGTIKAKARAESHQNISLSDMPDMGLIGFSREAIRYGKTLITYDPAIAAGASGGKSYMYCMTMDSWEWQVHSGLAWKFSGFTDQQPITRERKLLGDISLKARLICERPWQNGLYRDVS